ncbi:ATP synthase F0 subcomplex A subunit [Arboricoccus pini]|uniref:ATP synthase subunit a n=1 Tax=Arboricoccus pini TaxID=1963835 RepID=A0A212Q4W9_9PROT|nr:F0F1 ATP synthase subunit A [Arboricoccus pini]SNB54379.1 ATP synthase F0 subcomplex A subunit [Arboricoccus pini]
MDPLHQFNIVPLLGIQIGGLNLSFTNSAFWMLITVLLAYGLVMAGSRQRALVPGRLQSIVELGYEFVAGMVRDNAGKEGMRYFPVIFSLFMFVLIGNLVGMLPIPGHFTFTSHIIVTFFMAVCVIIGVTVVGFMVHGTHFLHFFVPPGAPKLMIPIMVPIEILSYLVRPISLSVRLFANMMAGHTMMAVFVGFIGLMGIFGIAPLLMVAVLTAFEIGIAIIQAYIFTVLTCLYLHDALHMH